MSLFSYLFGEKKKPRPAPRPANSNGNTNANNEVVFKHKGRKVWRDVMVSSNLLRGLKVQNKLDKTTMFNRIRKQMPASLTNNNVRKLVDIINYKDAKDVNNTLLQTAEWVRKQVGAEPYAMIVEDSPGSLKSTHWLAHKAIDAIGRFPVHVVSTDNLGWAYYTQPRTKTFVYFDDATYSGSQLEVMVRSLKDLADKRVRIIIAVGYATEGAIARIKKAAEDLSRARILFHARKTIHTPDFSHLPANQRQRIKKHVFSHNSDYHVINNNSNNNTVLTRKPLTVLAHKIPNGLSFPARLGKALGYEERDMQPPYKAIHWQMDRPVYAYVQNGLRFYVYKRSGVARRSWYLHVGYKDVGGKLVVQREFISKSPVKLRESKKRKRSSSSNNRSGSRSGNNAPFQRAKVVKFH